jgi:hypothetical protein
MIPGKTYYDEAVIFRYLFSGLQWQKKDNKRQCLYKKMMARLLF